MLDSNSLEIDINDFELGYLATDINGDGNVDLLDSSILETNIMGLFFQIIRNVFLPPYNYE